VPTVKLQRKSEAREKRSQNTAGLKKKNNTREKGDYNLNSGGEKRRGEKR